MELKLKSGSRDVYFSYFTSLEPEIMLSLAVIFEDFLPITIAVF